MPPPPSRPSDCRINPASISTVRLPRSRSRTRSTAMRAAAKSQQPPTLAPTPVAVRAAASAQHPPPHASLPRPTFLAPDPVSVNNHARSSLRWIRDCRSTTEPPTRVPMPLPLRVPARLLLARHKTTAAQHVAARHLDHAFERLAAAHLPLVAASPLVDALRASPEPRALPNLARCQTWRAASRFASTVAAHSTSSASSRACSTSAPRSRSPCP